MSPGREVDGRSWTLRLKLTVKVTVTVGLCTFLVWRADWPSLGSSFRAASAPLLLVVAGLMVASVTISAYKWQRLLWIHGANLPFNRLHRFYFTAVFFNNFLPSSMGGDGYRIYRTIENGRSKATALIAVLLERVSGVLVLLSLGFGAALLIALRTGDPLARGYVLIGAGGTIAALLGALIAIRFDVVPRMLSSARFPAKLAAAAAQFGDLRRKPGQALWALVGVSVFFHVHTIVFYTILLRALGASLSLPELTVVLALTSTIGILPITLNGIGLLDGAFAYLATHYGVAYEGALSTMMVVRGINLFISVIGAWFYFTEGSAEERAKLRGAAAAVVSDEIAASIPRADVPR